MYDSLVKHLFNMPEISSPENSSELQPTTDSSILTSFSEFHNNADILRIINIASIDIKGPDKNGDTVMHRLLKNDCANTSLIKLLIDNGADVNHRNHMGWSALHLAVRSARVDIVTLLVNSGCDIHARTGAHDTELPSCSPLHIAVHTHQPHTLKYLLECGGRLHDTDGLGRTPLEMCVSKNGIPAHSSLPLWPLLIRAGAAIRLLCANMYFLQMLRQCGLLGLVMHGGYSKVIVLHFASEADESVVQFIWQYRRQPCSLQDLAVNAVRMSIQPNVVYGVRHLPVPGAVRRLLVLDDVVEDVDAVVQDCVKIVSEYDTVGRLYGQPIYSI